jgi:hypothetical protein
VGALGGGLMGAATAKLVLGFRIWGCRGGVVSVLRVAGC